MRNLTATLATSSAALLAVLGAQDAHAQAHAYNWTGFYVGVNGGYGWGGADTAVDKVKANGWLAGLQTGYNWQLSGVVVGGEIDASLSGVRGKDPFFDDKDISVHQRWAGSARLRVGLPVNGISGMNGMLIYGTGGLAVSHWTTKIDQLMGGSEKDSATHIGWTAGGGVEMSLGGSLTGRLEYIYADYGKKKYFGAEKIDMNLNMIRLGLSYRFAAPPP
jgi:outer membrane immunogenic protein